MRFSISLALGSLLFGRLGIDAFPVRRQGISASMQAPSSSVNIANPISSGAGANFITTSSAARALATGVSSSSISSGNVAGGSFTTSAAGSIQTGSSSTSSQGGGSGSGSGSKTSLGSQDIVVLQFASVMEQLESNFYKQAIQAFSAEEFVQSGFVQSDVVTELVMGIQHDESIHLSTLQTVLHSVGQTPISACQFDFSSALRSPSSFIETARQLEFIGTSAYLGGASLVQDTSLLVSAASILSVEGRHSSMLNVLNGGTAVPQSFDVPLTPSQVLALASPFITGGCDVTSLGLKANTPLQLSEELVQTTLVVGSKISFSSTSALNIQSMDTSSMFVQMLVAGQSHAMVVPLSNAIIPKSVDGPVYMFLTNSGTPLAADITQQDSTIIVAGPALAFVDTQPDVISELLIKSNSKIQNIQSEEIIQQETVVQKVIDISASSVQAGKGIGSKGQQYNGLIVGSGVSIKGWNLPGMGQGSGSQKKGN